jgi:DNA-binding protein YbaB
MISRPRPSYLLTAFWALLVVVLSMNVALCSFHHASIVTWKQVGPTWPSSSCTALFINLGWFTGRNEDNHRDGNIDTNGDVSESGASRTAVMGGVASTMDSMENVKRTQRAGKVTRKLVQDLASTTVEGIAADGKVKVILDCQQRPMSVDIDEGYLEKVLVGDLCVALTSAMSDAHAKSIERMDEKMKGLYSELGMPSGGW